MRRLEWAILAAMVIYTGCVVVPASALWFIPGIPVFSDAVHGGNRNNGCEDLRLHFRRHIYAEHGGQHGEKADGLRPVDLGQPSRFHVNKLGVHGQFPFRFR